MGEHREAGSAIIVTFAARTKWGKTYTQNIYQKKEETQRIDSFGIIMFHQWFGLYNQSKKKRFQNPFLLHRARDNLRMPPDHKGPEGLQTPPKK